MRSLLDVNVLVALFDSHHVSHVAALEWFDNEGHAGWASCPITQNGCIRIMSQPTYKNAMPVLALVERLGQATAHGNHEFWADDLSLLAGTDFDATRIHGPKQLTDAYLLGLAVAHRGRLVTFDRSIPLEAVKGAQRRHLLVL